VGPSSLPIAVAQPAKWHANRTVMFWWHRA